MKCPDCGVTMPVEVCRSAAGYYIGRWCPNCGPWERISRAYFTTREQAEVALAEGDFETRDYASEMEDGTL